MKKWIPLLLTPVIFYTCKKDQATVYTATVVEQKGCGTTTYLVTLTGTPLPVTCGADSVTICREKAYILNLPASLQVPGKQFRFSSWSNKGPLCISAAPAPSHIDVYNASLIP